MGPQLLRAATGVTAIALLAMIIYLILHLVSNEQSLVQHIEDSQNVQRVKAGSEELEKDILDKVLELEDEVASSADDFDTIDIFNDVSTGDVSKGDTLAWNGNQWVGIANNNSDNTNLVNTDNQLLSISGNTLSIEGGNSVELSVVEYTAGDGLDLDDDVEFRIDAPKCDVTTEKLLWNGDDFYCAEDSGGVSDFLSLTDTPSSYISGSLLFTSGSAVMQDEDLFRGCTTKSLSIGGEASTFEPLKKSAIATISGIYGGTNSSLVLGLDGFPRIVHYSWGEPGELAYKQCLDASCSSYNENTIESNVWGDGRGGIDAEIGSDGLVRFTYYESNDDILKYVECNDDACSSPTITIVDEHPETRVGFGASLDLDSSDNPFISYMHGGFDNGQGGNLMLARYVGGGSGSGCADANWSCSIPDDGGRISDIEIGADGFPRIVHYFGSNSAGWTELRYVKCNNIDCTSSDITPLDYYSWFEGSDREFYPSLEFGQDGLPRIAYRDMDTYNLYFVQCLNDTCSSIANGSPTLVDPEEEAGRYSSMRIGSDGFARITYRASNEGMKYAECENADCSSNTITTFDSDIWVEASRHSLALNSNDNYTFVYTNDDNADLRIAYQELESLEIDENDLFVAGDIANNGDIMTNGSLLIQGGINQYSSDPNSLVGALNVEGDINTNGTYQIGGQDFIKAGSESIFIGENSGGNVNYYWGSTAIGYESLYNANESSANTAIGYQALYNPNGGWGGYNTAVGYQALYNNYSAYYNVASGYYALGNNYSGDGNVANGYYALGNNNSGGYNVANGYYALGNNNSGGYNVANGYQALRNNNSGQYNVAEGYRALYSNNSGSENIALGRDALYSRSGSYGSNNTALGSYSLYNNYSGGDNTAIGVNALYNNYSGSNNIAIGREALRYNYSGGHNTVNGYRSMYNNNSGSYNIASGYESLYGYNSAASGSYNVSLGYRSLRNNYSGSDNIAIGRQALDNNYNGQFNVASGYNALGNNWSGHGNIASGYNALLSNYSGSYNIAIGQEALRSNGSGSYNTASGYRALYSATGTGNIAYGYQAGDNISSGIRNIMIGYDVDAPSGWLSYQLNIGNLIYGTNVNGTGSTISSGNIGIGVKSPSAQFHTTGTVRFANFGAGTLTTDALGNVSVSSDERLKNIEGNFTRGLNDLLKINPISYTWKEETGYDTQNSYSGFSAQNVQESIPEAVGTDESGYLTLSDRPLLATAINAIKEQNVTISSNTLKTDTNVTSLTELQTSIDENLQNISDQFDSTQLVLDNIQTNINNLSNIQTEIQDRLDVLEIGLDVVTQIDERILTINPDTLVFTDTDTEGNTTLTLDGIMTVNTLKAESIETNTLTINDNLTQTDIDGNEINASSVGTATIAAGETSVTIETSAISADSRVFVSPKKPLDQTLAATEIIPGVSFVVELLTAKLEDITIDWFILQ